MALAGFDKSYYLGVKLQALQADHAEWSGKDISFLEDVLQNKYGLSAEDHYSMYGYKEGLAPNAYFNADQYVLAKATAMFNDKAYFSIDEAKAAFLAAWGDQDPYLHYVQYGGKENINPSNAFDESSYIQAKADAAGSTYAEVKAAFDAAGLTALTHYLAYGIGENLKPVPVPVGEQVEGGETTDTSGETFLLTVDQDNIEGTNFNDTFNAYIFDNQNTAQSGDMIDGNGGTDRLVADIGNSQSFAITLHTDSVEQFAVRAQHDNNNVADGQDQSDNNMNDNVQIDAERMEGTIWYESNNSRADLVIEDVRIERVEAYNDKTNQLTKDVTVAMVSTDAGDVDLDVYFDQHSLVREAPNSSNSISMTVGNQIETADFDANAPLEDIPYTDVTFLVNGSTVVLDLAAAGIASVETYDEMWTVFQTAFQTAQASAQYGDLLQNVTITRSIGTDAFTSRDNDPRTADEYILSITNGEITYGTVGWTADGGLPPNNAFSGRVAQGDVSVETKLITAEVVLDDVGRGSMGGDLVIGSMSTGETSDSRGVEQFDIFVDRDSELQNITSTANTLREVYITNRDHFADNNTTATGSLTVTGTVAGVVNDDEDGVPGTIDGYGFNDLQVLDASAMVGSVNINAVLTDAVVAKYLDIKDTATSSAADNVTFDYDMGTNNDTFALDISSSNLEVAGTGAREDFVLNIAGNGGDDRITTKIVVNGTTNLANATGVTNWYLNQKENANITVDGGAGNDFIHTAGAGDVIINAGTGNDSVYTDNSGNLTPRDAVNEIQTITFGAAGDFDTQSQVTVTLSDGQTFTTADTTVAAQAQVDTYSVAGGADGVLELNDTYVFTVNGFTATYASDGTHTGAEMAAAINANVNIAALVTAADNGAGGVTLTANVPGTAFTSSVVETRDDDNADSVTGAITTPNIVAGGADWTINTGDTAAQVAAKVAGIMNELGNNVTVSANNGVVTINYGANYAGAGSKDVGAATVVGIATDSAASVVVTTGGANGTDEAPATTEIAMIQLAAVVGATDTITFDNGAANVDITVTDTDGNGTISLVEMTNQIVAQAGTLTNWTLTESNASLGRLLFTSNTAGDVDDLGVVAEPAVASYITGAPVVVENAHTTVAGVDATAFVAGTAEVQTITIDNGADQAGQVYMQIDLDADGIFAADGSERFTFNINAGNEAEVAAQLASQINALSGVSAAQGAAGATIDDVIITWDVKTATSDGGSATQNAVTTTFTDGAVKSASVGELQKGLEAATNQAAHWVVNSNNTVLTDLDSAGPGNAALLYGAKLTVTFSGASTRGESGVTDGAAVANDNGFESTVTIGTTGNLGNHTNINQAIKDAITGDAVEGGASGANVLEELLTVNDGPANTVVIGSQIDGEFAANDLAITITAGTYASMNSSEKNSIIQTLRDIDNNSAATYTDSEVQARLDAAVAAYTASGALSNLDMATTDGTTLIAGSASDKVSDNLITLGAGDDVVVLGTDDQSNDVLVYTGYGNGNDTIVNFSETGTGLDMLHFGTYLNAQTSASGSAASAVDYAQTLNTDAIANLDEVTVMNGFAQDLGAAGTADDETWAGLDADKLLKALNNDNTDAEDSWGNIVEATLDSATIANLVGTTYNHVIMVENDLNDGQYKVFNITATNGTDFTACQLIGVLDFGDTLANLSDANFA